MNARAPKTRTAPVPAADDGVLRISTSSTPPVEEAREVLFVIDDEEFTVPKVIDQRIVYLGIDAIRESGPVFSGQRIVELLLGKPRYRRLLDLYEEQRITQDNFDTIVAIVSDLFFDHMNRDDDAAGKATPAS